VAHMALNTPEAKRAVKKCRRASRRSRRSVKARIAPNLRRLSLRVQEASTPVARTAG
jgi:hypothetical protein